MAANRALVAGAGIGGLTAALAMRRFGTEAALFEQAPRIGALGAGIQLSPNAVRVLFALGLEGPLRQVQTVCSGLEARSWKSGRRILWVPMGEGARARYGAPYLLLHRADLQAVLLQALGEGAVHCGGRCVGFEQDGSRARLLLADGRHETGDLLVGADGIHSVVRQGVAGARRPRFSGFVAWRALVPRERTPGAEVGPTATAWWGPGRHFVHYPVSGGRLVNWVAVVPAAEATPEGWSPAEARDHLGREFRGWSATVRALIRESERPRGWAIRDLSPLGAWSDGRVTLLGDAAHPMLPFMAQGAAQSIEDAWVLARVLAEAGGEEIPAALSAYEARRRPRTRRVQRQSRLHAHLFHAGPRPLRAARDVAIRALGKLAPSLLARGHDWIYGHDVTSGSGQD